MSLTPKSVLAMSISDMRRRYANARRRARYWSGNPGWNPALRARELQQGHMDDKYSLAMCDCKSWESYIGKAIGGEGAKPLKHYDPKAEFQRAFTRSMAAGEI